MCTVLTNQSSQLPAQPRPTTNDQSPVTSPSEAETEARQLGFDSLADFNTFLHDGPTEVYPYPSYAGLAALAEAVAGSDV